MKLQEIKDALMDFVDDRKMFHESWLCEMPGLADKLDTFPSMSIMLADFLKHGFQKIEVEKDIFKIKAADKMYYWVERNANPVLIVEISKETSALPII